MKHNLLFILITVILTTSCASTSYKFIQVVETKPADQNIKQTINGEIYEDSNCIIFHHFWANGGDASFAFYNKTNEIIYIDLSKSFFIKNGIANDYYKDRSWTDSEINETTNITTYSNTIRSTNIINFQPFLLTYPTTTNINYIESHGVLYSTSHSNAITTSKTSSENIKEQKIIAIPPKTYKIIAEYAISNSVIVDCDLTHYPKDSTSIIFTEENSPLHFENYITYKIGNNGDENTIENKFYISKVTNYAQPSLYSYILREKRPCQNITNNTGKKYSDKYPVKVYDRVINTNTSHSFYVKYKVYSNNQLYNSNYDAYYYNEQYDGYTQSPQTQFQSNVVKTKSGILINAK